MSGDVWSRDAESHYRHDPRRVRLDTSPKLAPSLAHTFNFPVKRESDHEQTCKRLSRPRRARQRVGS